jgi:hypothetical protein
MSKINGARVPRDIEHGGFKVGLVLQAKPQCWGAFRKGRLLSEHRSYRNALAAVLRAFQADVDAANKQGKDWRSIR